MNYIFWQLNFHFDYTILVLCDFILSDLYFLCQCGLRGPLVDFEGNIVGMNFYNSEGNTFLPRNKIQKMLECNLVHCILKSIHIQIQILSQIGIEASVGKYFIKHN